MYQTCLFERQRNIRGIDVINYVIFEGNNPFKFEQYNLIVGPMGSGKSTLVNALYASMGLSGYFKWDGLALFSTDKVMSVEGDFTTGFGVRKRRYRDKPICQFGIDKSSLYKVNLNSYKMAAGLYECQRTLFMTLNKKFINEFSTLKRLNTINSLAEYVSKYNDATLSLEKLVGLTNDMLSEEGLSFQANVQIDKKGFHIYKGKGENKIEVHLSTGQTCIVRSALILSLLSQLDFPPVIFDDDFELCMLDKANSNTIAKIIKKYDGQAFVFISDSSRTLIETCKSLSYSVINLDRNENNYKDVSMKIATRKYVSNTDLKLESKIELSNEILFNALKKKSNPVLAWSGGKDSTVALHLAIKAGLLNPVHIIRSNTLNEYPQQYKYNMDMENLWKDYITYDIPVFKDGIFNGNHMNGLLKPDITIWEIIKTKGFPLLPKGIRPSTAPYYDAVMKYCRIVVNDCCELLKEKKARKLYTDAGVDLVIRGMTGGESNNRKRHIALSGYTRYVKYYKTNICDCIGFWSEEDVKNYSKINNFPLCGIYDMGIPRNGCLVCAKNILENNNSLKVLRKFYPKVWHYLMIDLKMGVEILKLQYIIRKAQGLGLKKGDPQMQLDQFDIEYLNHIDKYEKFDLAGIFSHQPCKCDNI